MKLPQPRPLPAGKTKTVPRTKSIPTVVGLLFLVTTLAIGVYLTKNTTIFTSKASLSCAPINIQITNLTYKSLDISFITGKDCEVVTDINSMVFNDIRNLTKSKTHYFQIDNLMPQTNYQYKFLSEGNRYENQNFNITTFIKPNQIQPNTPLSWGRVYTPLMEPAAGSIVYLNIPNAYPLSAYVTGQGNWNIPLVYCYDIEGQSWFTPPPSTSEEIVAMSVDGQITMLTGNTSSNNPVPDIVLGQDHFQPTSVPVEYSGMSQNQNSDLIPTDLNLSNPQEGESLTNSQPQFFGQGPSGLQFEIELNSSSQQSGSVTVSQDGSWSWTPPQNIEPGQHTIKLNYTDPQTGILKTISRSFTVLAQGSDDSPAFTASSSAQTNTPMPAVISVSPTPTTKPTLAPTKTVTTPTPQIPVTGNSLPTAVIVIISTLIIVISTIFI